MFTWASPVSFPEYPTSCSDVPNFTSKPYCVSLSPRFLLLASRNISSKAVIRCVSAASLCQQVLPTASSPLIALLSCVHLKTFPQRHPLCHCPLSSPYVSHRRLIYCRLPQYFHPRSHPHPVCLPPLPVPPDLPQNIRLYSLQNIFPSPWDLPLLFLTSSPTSPIPSLLALCFIL